MFRRFHPNPFRIETIGQIALGPADAAEHVAVRIYDVRGRNVRTMARLGSTSGGYKVHWDGKDDWGDPVAAGIYFVRVDVGARTVHQDKLVCVR